MPRRRMLDPSFTDDTEVAQLSRDERLFLIGCLRNADDEGRLIGHPVYLKSEIFMYDEDINLERMKEIKGSTLGKMKGWRPGNVWLLRDYLNSDREYLYFPNWYEGNKPSHPRPSKFPVPPSTANLSGIAPEPHPNSSRETQETFPNTSRETQERFPKGSALGQVRQVKDSLGQVREVQEDFQKYFHSDNDLTDFLTKTLNDYMSSGRARLAKVGLGGDGPGEVTPEKEAAIAAQWGMPVLDKFWNQAVGTKLPSVIWHGAYAALQKFPVDIVARAFVKAARYQGGKHKSWKYVQTIIDEEMDKRGRSPPHP